MPRVVGSLTTIPSRIKDKNFITVLQSIKRQTHPLDAIYLTLPEKSNFGIEYPECDEAIKNICHIVTIRRDYGPICKIIGGLTQESDPETIIITFDDDIIYPETLVSELLEKNKLHPNLAIGSSGMIIGSFPFMYAWTHNQCHMKGHQFNLHVPDEGLEVDVLCGYAGVLYKRGFFPKRLSKEFLSLSDITRDVFLNDDVFISAYLSKQNVNRRIFLLSNVEDRFGMPGALSGDPQFYMRLRKAVNKLSEMGWFHSDLNPGIRSISGVILTCIVLFVIILVLICFLFFRR